MPHVSWSVQATHDAERIYTHFVKVSRTTALRAILTLQRECDILCDLPSLGRARPGGLREFTVRFGRGAFLVLYDPTATPVQVEAVRHSREAGYKNEKDLAN